MPELPAIQALAERIEARLAGARFARAEPLSFSGLKTVAPPPSELVGERLVSVGRRGKFLLLVSDSLTVAVHLSQGGRIDFEVTSRPGKPKGAVARFAFDRPPRLLLKEFGTERKAGWWVLANGDEGPMAKLGPEPFSEEFTSLVLEGRVTGRLHSMLRDQRRVAGIGR